MTSHPRERRLRGIAMRITSATSFALMAALLKAASARGVSTPEMIFYRNGWALLVVATWLTLGPGWQAVRTKAPAAHLTRSAVGLVSMLLTFGALALLPLGEATALTYAAPIIATESTTASSGRSSTWTISTGPWARTAASASRRPM
jgi:drug/metabolite transporter (DMT)-like permease